MANSEGMEFLVNIEEIICEVIFEIKVLVVVYKGNALAVNYKGTTSMANPPRKASMAHTGWVALVVCFRKVPYGKL